MDGLNFYIDASEDDREARKRFASFANHIDIYEAAINAYIAVGRAFGSKELNSYPERALYMGTLREWMQAVGGSANRLNNYMAVEKNYIETKVSLPPIELAFNYRNMDALQKAEKIIREYFPGFQIPRTFYKNNAPIGRTFHIEDNMNELTSVERLSRVKTDFTPGIEVDGAADGFKLAKNYADRGFGQIAYLDLTLQMEDARLEDRSGSAFGLPDKGTLLEGYIARPVLTIDAVFRWPMEFAKWVTCTGEKDEFVPFMFFQYINAHRAAYLNKRTRGGGYSTHTPGRVNHLGKIVDMMAEERKQGRIAKIRTNADGFLILGTGEPAQLGAVLWVPIVNNVNEYMNQIKSCYDAQEKTINLSMFKMGGVPILTDPNNEKFTYVRESGARGSNDISGLITFDLTGSVALDDTTIFRYLNTKLSFPENQENLKNLYIGLYQYATGAIQGGTGASAFFDNKRLEQFGFDAFDQRKGTGLLSEAADFFLENPDLETRWGSFSSANKIKINLTGVSYEEGSEELKNASEGIQSKVKRARAMLELTRLVAMKMLGELDSLKLGFAAKVEFWKFHLYLVSNYSTNTKDLELDYKDKVALNSARAYSATEVLDPKGLTIPNMPGLKKVLPHQAECFLDINMEPEMLLLEADVGGGKGMMGPTQALMFLQKGLIKRPLFLVPGRLVANWTNEIGKYTQGEVNPFPLTLPIVRRLQRVYKGEKGNTSRPDYSFLKKIIDACPVNTFFISSFNFLVSDNETITYANSEAQRYYAAEFFRDLGVFDLVILDESHVVKNLSTRATVASSIVASPAKYKTEMSGTIVSNTLMDLVGQTAIGNPSALGNSKRFAQNYALEYSGRGGDLTVSLWRPDAAAMIVNDMKPYTKRVIKKKDRWAFILPKTNELFHTTSLTKTQQNFYDYLLDREIEELKKKNPSLYEKMMDGNEKDEGAISVGLDIHFQTLEAFLGAPDLNDEYMKIKGLTDEDLTSAKLKETIKILDNHFQGYTDDQGTFVKPSAFKVIIFAARIPTVQHFERRMPEKYKKMMATYYAGQEQALEAFKNVPGIKILLAAEMSANTGQNFQMGSRLIRTEALWAPGGQIQAAGRIDRPDFENRGRDEIYLDWIMVNKTMDVAKIARIISKNVEKMKYDRQEDPYFVARPFVASDFIKTRFGKDLPLINKPGTTIEKMFINLPLIKMNIPTFLRVNDYQQLGDYFASYALILDFQDQQFSREKREGLHQLIDITPEMRSTLPNSKPIDFMPRIPNVDPVYFDRNNEYGFKPISRLQMEMDLQKIQKASDFEEEMDEENATYVEVNPVNEGDLVDTEFGIGTVSKILKNEVWVDIKGFRKVRVLKACAWLITNDDKLKEIKRDLNRGKLFIKTLPGISPDQAAFAEPEDTEEPDAIESPALPTPPEPERPGEDLEAPEKPTVDQFDEEEQEEHADTTADGDVDMYAYVIDGEVALTCFAEDENLSNRLINDFGFMHFASYYAIQVKTAKALDQVLSLLQKKFTINPKALSDFEPYKTLLKNPGAIDTVTAGNFKAVAQFFKRDVHRRLQKGQLRPYPIAFGKMFFIAIDQISTPSYNQALQIVKQAAIPGVKILPRRQDDVHVKFYPSTASAATGVKEIDGSIKIANMKAYQNEDGVVTPSVLDMLKSMRTVRSVVKTIAPSAKTPAKPVAPTLPKVKNIGRK